MENRVGTSSQQKVSPHGKLPCKASLCGAYGCKQRHYKLLHPGDPKKERDSSASSSAVTGVVTVHQNGHNKVLLRIIPVMFNANGRSIQTFAKPLLDGGSDSTLVEKLLVDQLGVQVFVLSTVHVVDQWR